MPTSVCFNQYGPEVEVRELTDLPKQDVGGQIVFSKDIWTVLGYDTDHEGRDQWAIVGFGITHAVSMGIPNDDALHGHPLFERGLKWERNYEIHNSPWIKLLKDADRIRGPHKPGDFSNLRHIVMTFHDSLFEVITRGYTFEIIDPVKIDRHERMLTWLKAGRHPEP
jgi:hypothetical protein